MFLEDDLGEVKVSIVVLTYNHARFIRKALDSILMQKVNFKYEIIVGDDCSTDDTQEILKEYERCYPKLFRMRLRDANIGATNNAYELLMSAKGEYIAHLEGDDFWTDENKLQVQVDFLDINFEYAGCTHLYDIVNKYGSKSTHKVMWWQSNEEIFDKEEYEKGKLPGQTATFVHRNCFLDNRHDYSIFYKAHPLIGDRTLMLFVLIHGNIYMLPKTMSAYRFIEEENGKNANSLAVNEFQLRYENYLYRIRLENYAKKEFNYDLNMSPAKLELFRGAVGIFVASPSTEKLKVIKDIINLSDKKILYFYFFIQKILIAIIKKVIFLPKNFYKWIRKRAHGDLIELLNQNLHINRIILRENRQLKNKIYNLEQDIDDLQIKVNMLSGYNVRGCKRLRKKR